MNEHDKGIIWTHLTPEEVAAYKRAFDAAYDLADENRNFCVAIEAAQAAVVAIREAACQQLAVPS